MWRRNTSPSERGLPVPPPPPPRGGIGAAKVTPEGDIEDGQECEAKAQPSHGFRVVAQPVAKGFRNRCSSSAGSAIVKIARASVGSPSPRMTLRPTRRTGCKLVIVQFPALALPARERAMNLAMRARQFGARWSAMWRHGQNAAKGSRPSEPVWRAGRAAWMPCNPVTATCLSKHGAED
jgi:hypothetical protein